MKRLFSILLGVVFTTGIYAGGAAAQDGSRAINSGVLNGKATSLPKPVYPDSLRQAGIEGIVVVRVIIDEAGNVIFAESDLNDQRVHYSADGTVTVLDPVVVDPQLREAAETAARSAKFLPTVLGSVAHQVKGKIVYNFIARVEKKAKISERDSETGAESHRGGVLNGKAVYLPLPQYPAAARAVKAGGAVNVQITIDEEGNVISATAVSGHPLLRSAAVTAAAGAKFSPTILDGQPINVTGVLTYSFVP